MDQITQTPVGAPNAQATQVPATNNATANIKSLAYQLGDYIKQSGLTAQAAKASQPVLQLLQQIYDQWKTVVNQQSTMGQRALGIGQILGMLGLFALPAGSILLPLIMWYIKSRLSKPKMAAESFSEWVILMEALEAEERNISEVVSR